MTGLRAARLAAGVTQEQLAARTGMRQSSISKLETTATNPSWRVVQRLAEALRADPRDLFPDQPSA